MNLREILSMVDAMVTNDLSPSLKISWINQIQNQLYRDYPLPEAIHSFHTIPNQAFYELPEDCREDRISHVMIGENKYPYVPQGFDIDASKFCSIVTGTLLIHPVPKQATLSFLHYKPSPNQLSAENLEEEPTFPKDFHELLVLGCASRVAKTNPETLALARIFDEDFLRLADKADRVITKYKPKRTLVVRSWV